VIALRALAPAKVNLGLRLGPLRAGDQRHELVTVMQSISLADEVTLEPARGQAGEDEISCPGVPGAPRDNLAAAALRCFRAATGWDEGPLRLTIAKRIPVAAGLGGGSADAAAALRLLQRASGVGDAELMRALAESLGADVPAQVSPGRWLASGGGERLEALPQPSPPLKLLLLPLATTLATSAVYAEADRLGLTRTEEALARRRRQLRDALADAAPLPAQRALLANDLALAASSLCPQIAPALEEARGAGAHEVLVSGSGPTIVALFSPADGSEGARRAAAALGDRNPAPIRATSVTARYAQPQPLAARSRSRG
jgi:4-diphosphocytidyl-2-C-methyl-D-erythritol kinase